MGGDDWVPVDRLYQTVRHRLTRFHFKLRYQNLIIHLLNLLG